MMTRDELKAAFVEAGLGRIAQTLSALCEPCVLVRTHAHPYDTMGVGTSRIGGLPDLPKNIDWPTWREKPLTFLGQFRLADLSRFDCCRVLPSSGHLWFFYDSEQITWGFDPQDRGSWRILYADTNEADVRRREVRGLPTYSQCTLTLHNFLSIPGPEHLSVAPLKLTLDEIEQIEEIDRDLHEMIESGSHDQGYEPHHQLLGHPREIQGEMQLECQLVSNGLYCGDATGYQDPARKFLEQGAKDWQLLFQLDADDDLGMMWGDCGRLYFWVRRQDLAKRVFENAWMVLQCS